MIEILLCIIAGAFAGFSSGLLGIGGGLIIVPFLVFLLPRLNFPAAYMMHIAVGTSLALIVLTSISSIYAHHRKGAIDWVLFKKLLIGLIFGALLGAYIAGILKSTYLQVIFGFFVFFMAYNLGLKKIALEKVRHLPSSWLMQIHSILIAAFCTLLGMGGGSLFVPYFNQHGMNMRKAVAISAACCLPLALAGVIGLLIVSVGNPMLPQSTFGYVYWPALISMGIPSILVAPWGASVAHKLSVPKLKQIFAIFLLFVGVDMLWRPLEHLFHIVT